MSRKFFKEEDFGLIKSGKYTRLLPYVLEMRDPEVEIHLAHLIDVSLIVLPQHRIAFWGDREELDDVYETLISKWDSIRFNQDMIITFFPFSKIDYYPGNKVEKNLLTCSINHMQGFNSTRKFSSQKEFSPSDLKKNLGQYDTPFWLAKQSVSQLMESASVLDKAFSFVDPMAGEGSFLEASFHGWIIKTLKVHLETADFRDPTCIEANKLLSKMFSIGKILGIERDKTRGQLLNKHFSAIFKNHNFKSYTVAVLKDLFEVSRKDIKAQNIIFVGNPCWDVIETTKTVRSRTKSAVVKESKRPSKEKLLQEKTVSEFEEIFDVKCSLKDYRNIYSLTMAKCLSLSEGEASFSMVLPKGVLGDKTTHQLREVIGEYRPQLFIDEFKNKASGSRIFPAVDARVQFCIVTVIPNEKISRFFKTRRHGVDFNPERNYVNVSWGWGEKRFFGTNQWIVFKDKVDKAVADKVTSYPALEIHNSLQFEAGTSKVQEYFLEGKDIECFKVRKSGKRSKYSSRILVRKILPNGGRKLIAATDCGNAKIKDSLVSIKVEGAEEHVYYLLGILNSVVGEYRLRMTQSNINLNLWKLKQLHLPEYDSCNSLHSEISRVAKSLSQNWSHSEKIHLEELVQELFGLSDNEAKFINNEMKIPERAA